MIKHLKAFFTRQEMLDDWNKCVQTADEAKFNQMTMTKDGVETFHTYYDHTNDGRIEMQIAGREMEKILCDIRIPHYTQQFMFSRLRSVNEQAKLSMEMFYKEIRE